MCLASRGNGAPEEFLVRISGNEQETFVWRTIQKDKLVTFKLLHVYIGVRLIIALLIRWCGGYSTRRQKQQTACFSGQSSDPELDNSEVQPGTLLAASFYEDRFQCASLN